MGHLWGLNHTILNPVEKTLGYSTDLFTKFLKMTVAKTSIHANPSSAGATISDLPVSIRLYLDKNFPGHSCCRIRKDQHQFDIEIRYQSQTHWLVFSNTGILVRNESDVYETTVHHDIDVWIEAQSLPALVMEHLGNHFPGCLVSQVVATWSRGRVTKYKVVLLLENSRHEMEFYGRWKL